MRSECCSRRTPLFVGITFLLAAILFELTAILLLNSGKLVYTLDDAYIHLALAAQILQGHYGVNAGEFSAPASSILWPFILAPISTWVYAPLALNILFSLLTVCVFANILSRSLQIENNNTKLILESSLLILLVIATNLIGLVFTGMEHSLQILLVALIALGLMEELHKEKVPPWLLVAIVVAPLIRYENLAITVAAIAYLLLRKYTKQAIATSLLIVLLVGGFSLFLTRLGLDSLPTSVIAKSSIAESRGTLASVLGNFQASLRNPRGILLALGMAAFLAYFFFAKTSNKHRHLAFITAMALAMHLVVGKYGWYNRYEIYTWTFMLLIAYILAAAPISRPLDSTGNLPKIMLAAAAFVVLTAYPYIVGLKTIPLAANNIYEQQYQMHRFAVEYYKKPVAVNDLGYVTYNNDQYVLDLLGLASIDALDARRNDQDSQWMNDLAKSKNVKFAMIYENIFPTLPQNWTKLGTLHLSRTKITPASSEVTFYALTDTAIPEITTKLRTFQETLPQGVRFILIGGVPSQ